MIPTPPPSSSRPFWRRNGLVQGYSYWTFSDIFEENYFPSVPFHGGFGVLQPPRHPQAVLPRFQVLHGLGTELMPVTGSHATVDCWVVQGGEAVRHMR